MATNRKQPSNMHDAKDVHHRNPIVLRFSNFMLLGVTHAKQELGHHALTLIRPVTHRI